MEMFLQDDYIMDLNTSMPLNPMTLLEEGEADDHALRGDRPSNLQRRGLFWANLSILKRFDSTLLI
jgi:hypothetical protein